MANSHSPMPFFLAALNGSNLALGESELRDA